jgi:tetratricopeptide (TPR) repeat protein
MRRRDSRSCAITGATSAALDAFERALAASQSWRTGADRHVEAALREAPAFVMAHVLQAYLLVCGRDPVRARAARPIVERAARLRANVRERTHLAAISALFADDYERAKALLGELLRACPRDVLALQVAHFLDYVTGDVARMADRIVQVLPAWSSRVPGYHAVLAMQAFGLEESGDYDRAEDVARQALELDSFDARAHHVIAHVYEMTERADAGVRWMNDRMPYWAADTVVATHCWWHLALFHLGRGEIGRALALYDRRVRGVRSLEVADMIDAASLLWRIELDGGDGGERWHELASAWAPRVGDAFCTFNDLHAMLSFVGARDFARAQRLERELAISGARSTRHGETTRRIGLPASRALIAYGRGDYTEAVALLATLPALAHRIGGSHAQRDVLNLTLLRAVQRMRRGMPTLRIAA